MRFLHSELLWLDLAATLRTLSIISLILNETNIKIQPVLIRVEHNRNVNTALNSA